MLCSYLNRTTMRPPSCTKTFSIKADTIPAVSLVPCRKFSACSAAARTVPGTTLSADSSALDSPHFSLYKTAISPRRVAQRQSTVGLNSPSIFICCSFCGSKQSFQKPPTYSPQDFPLLAVFSTNKTFEGQLKPSKPFSYRSFSWLTLCGCQVRNKNFCKKISLSEPKPIRFQTQKDFSCYFFDLSFSLLLDV